MSEAERQTINDQGLMAEVERPWWFWPLLVISGLHWLLGLPLGVLAAGYGHYLIAIGVYLAMAILGAAIAFAWAVPEVIDTTASDAASGQQTQMHEY